MKEYLIACKKHGEKGQEDIPAWAQHVHPTCSVPFALWEGLGGRLVSGSLMRWGCFFAVVFCGTAPDPASVAAVLRGPGMLDHVIELAPPGTEERSGLLRVALESRNASFSLEHLQVCGTPPSPGGSSVCLRLLLL